jgi:uncharacterized protein (TIGR03067 family)
MRLLALVLMLSGVAHPAGATTAAEGAAALAGAWTAVTAEQNGAPAPELVGHRLVFTGDEFTIYAPDGKLLYGGTYTIDTAKQPARIDFHGAAAGDKGQTWEGIYRQHGDSLTTVDDAPDPAKGRPTRFAAPLGSGHVLIEFRRSR